MEFSWQFSKLTPFLSVCDFASCLRVTKDWHEKFEKCRYFCLLSQSNLLPVVASKESMGPPPAFMNGTTSDASLIRQPWDPSKKIFYAGQVGFQYINTAQFLLVDAQTEELCSLLAGREDKESGFKVRQTRTSVRPQEKGSADDQKDALLKKHAEEGTQRPDKPFPPADDQQKEPIMLVTHGLYFRRGFEAQLENNRHDGIQLHFNQPPPRYTEPFEEWVVLKTALWGALQQGALVNSEYEILDRKNQPLWFFILWMSLFHFANFHSDSLRELYKPFLIFSHKEFKHAAKKSYRKSPSRGWEPRKPQEGKSNSDYQSADSDLDEENHTPSGVPPPASEQGSVSPPVSGDAPESDPDPWLMEAEAPVPMHQNLLGHSEPDEKFFKDGLRPEDLKASVKILEEPGGIEVEAFILADWGGGLFVRGGWDLNLYHVRFCLRRDPSASGGISMLYETENVVKYTAKGYPISL
uniref:Uncharacterized protein n=1 Tax=Chromera velia CCMP2878 TaxID=1169474 RepID=A0A0G4FN58_9ALVE|eukprot:Cvel_17690.t1-p1 / transcript=Cvel_17690.t1 / gene=Cvel_17690 / organism=Chromera_velia_CCMP2878 / gene_product=hypothetical protein / transcript_product=hypothetical protein / location=Cvel_scaffold1427:23110-24507(+) / protein_length=466 / sequence_SO=supercontig / SO=protein_coding / is_pseudo=false